MALGSMRCCMRRRAGKASRAPALASGPEVRASLSKAEMNRATPSAVFRAMLPVKPSVTTTSTVPLAMSVPSTKPR